MESTITENIYRTHHCGQLRSDDAGETVRLSGWTHRIRDHGGLLFIDLRDQFGLTQCVADPDSDAFKVAETVHAEWAIAISGIVRIRPDDTANPELATGDIEVAITDIEILSECPELPLPVFGEPDYPEETRLKYRFLDLRRTRMLKNLKTRAKVLKDIRESMDSEQFTEVQTPILTASSPEGARDFLVPSRLYPGSFYALPQAPQQFKQMLMVAGIDRYYSIAPCFRDESTRSDRLYGEFYQLDLEMAFVEQDDLMRTMNRTILNLFAGDAGFYSDKKPHMDANDYTQYSRDGILPKIPYREAIERFATDKPDLRNPLEYRKVTDHFRDSDFGLFANMIANDSQVEVWGIAAPGMSGRADCDRMNSWAIKEEKQPGLGYIYFRDEDGQTKGGGPIAKNLGDDRTEAIRSQFGLQAGDSIFFIAGRPDRFIQFAGNVRIKLGQELELVDENLFKLCWITDFPMYETDQETGKLDFGHNPFSMPVGGMAALESMNPLDITAQQFDLVCNGYEIGSGAIRNHKPDALKKAFELVGYSDDELQEKFGGMLRALSFGAPPHGGMALGIDRIVMLLCREQNLREVVAFPLSASGKDLLMCAPSEVPPTHLTELGIRVNPTVPKQTDQRKEPNDETEGN